MYTSQSGSRPPLGHSATSVQSSAYNNAVENTEPAPRSSDGGVVTPMRQSPQQSYTEPLVRPTASLPPATGAAYVPSMPPHAVHATGNVVHTSSEKTSAAAAATTTPTNARAQPPSAATPRHAATAAPALVECSVCQIAVSDANAPVEEQRACWTAHCRTELHHRNLQIRATMESGQRAARTAIIHERRGPTTSSASATATPRRQRHADSSSYMPAPAATAHPPPPPPPVAPAVDAEAALARRKKALRKMLEEYVFNKETDLMRQCLHVWHRAMFAAATTSHNDGGATATKGEQHGVHQKHAAHRETQTCPTAQQTQQLPPETTGAAPIQPQHQSQHHQLHHHYHHCSHHCQPYAASLRSCSSVERSRGRRGRTSSSNNNNRTRRSAASRSRSDTGRKQKTRRAHSAVMFATHSKGYRKVYLMSADDVPSQDNTSQELEVEDTKVHWHVRGGASGHEGGRGVRGASSNKGHAASRSDRRTKKDKSDRHRHGSEHRHRSPSDGANRRHSRFSASYSTNSSSGGDGSRSYSVTDSSSTSSSSDESYPSRYTTSSSSVDAARSRRHRRHAAKDHSAATSGGTRNKYSKRGGDDDDDHKKKSKNSRRREDKSIARLLADLSPELQEKVRRALNDGISEELRQQMPRTASALEALQSKPDGYDAAAAPNNTAGTPTSTEQQQQQLNSANGQGFFSNNSNPHNQFSPAPRFGHGVGHYGASDDYEVFFDGDDPRRSYRQHTDKPRSPEVPLGWSASMPREGDVGDAIDKNQSPPSYAPTHPVYARQVAGGSEEGQHSGNGNGAASRTPPSHQGQGSDKNGNGAAARAHPSGLPRSPQASVERNAAAGSPHTPQSSGSDNNAGVPNRLAGDEVVPFASSSGEDNNEVDGDGEGKNKKGAASAPGKDGAEGDGAGDSNHHGKRPAGKGDALGGSSSDDSNGHRKHNKDREQHAAGQGERRASNPSNSNSNSNSNDGAARRGSSSGNNNNNNNASSNRKPFDAILGATSGSEDRHARGSRRQSPQRFQGVPGEFYRYDNGRYYNVSGRGMPLDASGKPLFVVEGDRNGRATRGCSPLGAGRLNPYCSVCRRKYNLVLVDVQMRPLRWSSPRTAGLEQFGDCRTHRGRLFGGPASGGVGAPLEYRTRSTARNTKHVATFVPVRFRRAPSPPTPPMLPRPLPAAPIVDTPLVAPPTAAASAFVSEEEHRAKQQLRQQERRLRRCMKDILWRDLPAHREREEWSQYDRTLAEGLKLLEGVQRYEQHSSSA